MKQRSLKFQLVYDLILILLCGLLISDGILTAILRKALPEKILPHIMIHVDKLHQQGDSPSVEIDEKGLYTIIKKPSIKNPPSELFKEIKGPSSTLGFLFFSELKGYHIWKQDPSASWTLYEVSIQPLHLFLTTFKYRGFFIILGISLLLTFLGYFILFRRNVLEPIQELGRTAKAFRAGNFSARCAPNKTKELSDVGETLNQLAQNIEENEKKLVLTIQSLKVANEELEKTKNEQLQIEKLASVGRLAAGVAHEVGNPLGAISGYVDILRSALQKQPTPPLEDIDLCDRVEKEVQRISNIVKSLLQQARPTKEKLKNVLIKDLIEKTIPLANISNSIQVAVELEDPRAEVIVEEDQMIQVLLNLFLNAKHAIAAKRDRVEPGILKIKCAKRRLPLYESGKSKQLNDEMLYTSVARTLKPETYWVIHVEDNGTGIKPEDQSKLFEPFFSTKPTGQGTGLGLYVCKSIVESFQGAITVRSAYGYGASFSIYLPLRS